ncbi:hypothetical protein BCR36DRAFT_406659 [Piromyces finnis]|uniref:RING-type domain-containing protein n=1 Tax=Piromyces finnis TaxID=1754191 RepID=A0A1Y1UYI6_9FUNG|nr:hypothetical protein BCR36DRAFT_406659 [Piromyces finnis]|eukprot:ORX43586.1 hypothetical protein BCR36DRAFT_406659 [Piromyces finnis]
MENNSFSDVEIIEFTPKYNNYETMDSEEKEKINTSSYSIPTSSMYYNSEEESTDNENINEKNVKPKKQLKITNPDLSSSNSKEKSESIKNMKNQILGNNINISLQNNINDNTPDLSPISNASKILPSNLNSIDNKRKSLSSNKKSDIDTSSIVVEINDEDEEIIDIDNNNINDSFVVIDKQMNNLNAENLKKKLEMAENRISLTTSGGDFTYVNNDQSQIPRSNIDLSMQEKSDIVNTNVKRLTDTTSVPPVFNDQEKIDNNEIDKATADICNAEHKVTIDDDDDDNTCAICLIETQKPTDIENLNKDGSNETVVSPSKEDIDNYECKLHCMHKFHYSCIAQWLERNQNCPICRMEIKHYEIEAIEKRFDISIKVKEEPLPLVVPRYNNSFDFDIVLTPELVKNYMANHMPWINFKAYIYIRFFFFMIGYLALTVFGIVTSILSFLDGHDRFIFASYAIIITLTIGYIIFLVDFLLSIKKRKVLTFMIRTPALSTYFYGIVALLFFILLACMNYYIDSKKTPFTLEKVYQYVIMFFFTVMMIWSCIEAMVCYSIYKENDRRIVDADVSRRNQEIIERSRREEAEERAEFERNFSHLND